MSEKAWEASRLRSKRFYENNREHCKAVARAYGKLNRDRIRAKNIRYNGSAKGKARALMYSIKRRKWECTITVEWLTERIEGGFCEATGTLFDCTAGGGWKPFAPSVDRLDIKVGYTEENCRVVSAIFNLARNQFTDDDVLKMARALVEKNK